MRWITFFVMIFFVNFSYAQKGLYPDEKLIEINQIQTLYKFIPGDATKPLVIFVPGDAHLARISYGFPGGKEDDFLAYWFHKKGYPFLGVSYPTDNEVFSKIYPNFNIRVWGNHVASLVKKILQENQLSNHVVVLGWGMGGHIEESIQESFDKLHVTCDEFIAMSATAPLPYSLPSEEDSAGMLTNHLLDRKSKQSWFMKQLAEQNTLNSHEIIPQKIYQEEFLGNIPVALRAQGYFYKEKENKFVYNIQKAVDDTGVFQFSHMPWLGVLVDDSLNLPQITVFSPSTWSFLRNEMLYRQVVFYANIENNIDKFAITKRIINQIPQHFSDIVHGNHLFFVGKHGARDTEQKVETLMQRINTTRQNLVRLALD